MLPALAGLASECTTWELATGSNDVHLGVPSPSATLILSLGDPLDTGWLDHGATSGFRILLAGLHVRPSLVRTHGRQVGLQLELSPQAVARCFGLPIAALRGQIVELGDVAPSAARDLAERVADEPSWSRRALIVQRRLADLAHDSGTVGMCVRGARDGAHPVAGAAWDAFAAGGTSVSAAADRIGVSRRLLSSAVGAAFGVTPKQLARLHRFDRARRLATAGISLADAAARCGYVDQAHLCNEWRDFAARSPRATLDRPFFAEGELEFPFLQDAAPRAAR